MQDKDFRVGDVVCDLPYGTGKVEHRDAEYLKTVELEIDE